MAVRCSKCGEELLGPVNRCWKCGQQFTAQSDAGGLPPVRYAPVELPSDVVMAELSGGPVTATVQGEATAHSSSAPPTSAPSSAGPGGTSVRTGSPFVRGAVMQAVSTPAFPRNPLTPGFSSRIPGPPGHDPLAVAGAVIAILMGIFSLGIAWMQSWVTISAAVVIALVGFAMGIWGLYSKRRGWALFGIIISCAGLGLATYTGARLVYEMGLERQEAIDADPELLP